MASKSSENEKEEKTGRPSAYETIIKPRMDEIVSWCESGLVDEDICANLGIGTTAWYKYKAKYEEFAEAVLRAKTKADERVINALFQRCQGIEYNEETQEPLVKLILREVKDSEAIAEILSKLPDAVKDALVTTKKVGRWVPPDVLAIKFWLMNRQRGRWADKSEVEHKGGTVSTIVIQGLYGQPGDIPLPAGAVVVGECGKRNAITGGNGNGNGNGNGQR